MGLEGLEIGQGDWAHACIPGPAIPLWTSPQLAEMMDGQATVRIAFLDCPTKS